jgi:hypothetical protein
MRERTPTSRVAFVTALALVALPIQAQSPSRADTLQIRAAAVAFSKPEIVRSIGRLRILADTAWAFVHNPDSAGASITTVGGVTTIGDYIKLRAVRVERRNGRWVAVRVGPKMLP